MLLAIYVLLRQQKLDLPHCIGRIIFALLRAVGVYLVLNIAVILILEIIDALLVDIDTFRVELNIQLMLSALAYFPTCLLAVSDTSEDNAAFTKKFVSYVLLPCSVDCDVRNLSLCGKNLRDAGGSEQRNASVSVQVFLQLYANQ